MVGKTDDLLFGGHPLNRLIMLIGCVRRWDKQHGVQIWSDTCWLCFIPYVANVPKELISAKTHALLSGRHSPTTELFGHIDWAFTSMRKTAAASGSFIAYKYSDTRWPLLPFAQTTPLSSRRFW